MKRPVLAANWKMNNGPTAAKRFMETFLAGYPPRNDRAEGGGRDESTRDAATPRWALANAESHLSGFSARVRAGVGDRHWTDCIRRRCIRNPHPASIGALPDDRHARRRDPDTLWWK